MKITLQPAPACEAAMRTGGDLVHLIEPGSFSSSGTRSLCGTDVDILFAQLVEDLLQAGGRPQLKMVCKRCAHNEWGDARIRRVIR